MLMLMTPLLSMILLPVTTKTKWAMSMITMSLLTLTSMTFLYAPSTVNQSSYMLIMDQLSTTMVTLSMWISMLMIMNSNKVMKMSLSPNTFIFMVTALLITLIASFTSNSLISFYILFEISLIPTLILILMWGYQPERLQASMYLMMYTTVASLPLLASILLISSKFSTSSMLVTITSSMPSILTSSTASIWWAFCILAFLVKMPMYTTHLWLPKAHVEAPIAGSMILAGILLKLGSYGILRMFQMFPNIFGKINFMVLSISLMGALYTSMICTRQPDMKSLIAYASVSHMGLLLSSLMLPSSWSLAGALMMMIAHGLASSAMFALANSMYETSKTRSMILTKGLLCFAPSMSMWLFLASISNLGAPPSMNLAAEIMLLTNIINKSTLAIFPIAIMSFYTAVYSLLLFTTTQHNSTPEFFNPMSLPSLYFHTSSLLHLAPLAVFALKTDPCSMWLI